MIAWLRGRLLEKQPTRLVLDVHGVGYDVAVPVSTFYAVGEPGAESRRSASTRTCARMRWRSTASRPPFELTVFEKLIATSGIGPKLALAVLSGIDAVDFVARRAARRRRASDPHSRRRQAHGGADVPRTEGQAAGRRPTRRRQACRRRQRRRADDLVSALLNLGYHRSAVDKVLDKQLAGDEPPRFEAALRAALKELARA